MRVIAVFLLTSLVLTLHVKISKEDIPWQASLQRLQHSYDRGQLTSENTKNTDHPELVDTQLVIPMTLGKVEVKLVLDSTEYGTWVQSRKLQSQPDVCVGCPAQTDPFTCVGSCSVDPNQPTNGQEPIPVFDGRHTITELIATEKTSQIASSTLKNFKFGLVSKIDENLDTIQANRGGLGFGFSKTQSEKYEAANRQVSPVPLPLVLSEDANLVRQISKQNKHLAPKPIIAIKLEDDLNVVTFGAPEPYFKKNKGVSYQNQATDTGYRLKLTELIYGDTPDKPTVQEENSQPVRFGQSVPPPPNDMQVLIDTTGKFLTFPDDYIDQLAIILQKDGKTCIKPTDKSPLIQCQCKSKEDIKSFKSLQFKFNKQTVNHQISKFNYVQFVNGACYLNIARGLVSGTSANHITLGTSFFKDNYVVFDQDQDLIEISDAFQVLPSPLKMDPNNRYTIATVGIIMALASIVMLLGILKQIGFVPPSQVKQVEAPFQPQTTQFTQPHIVERPQSQSVVYAQPPATYQIQQQPPQQLQLQQQPIYFQSQTQTQAQTAGRNSPRYLQNLNNNINISRQVPNQTQRQYSPQKGQLVQSGYNPQGGYQGGYIR